MDMYEKNFMGNMDEMNMQNPNNYENPNYMDLQDNNELNHA